MNHKADGLKAAYQTNYCLVRRSRLAMFSGCGYGTSQDQSTAVRDSGSAAIEFGISLPLLALLFVVVAEIGFTAYQSLQVQNAVEAGLVYAVKNGNDSNGISKAVVNSSGLAGITAMPAPTQFCGCPSASGIGVFVLCYVRRRKLVWSVLTDQRGAYAPIEFLSRVQDCRFRRR